MAHYVRTGCEELYRVLHACSEHVSGFCATTAAQSASISPLSLMYAKQISTMPTNEKNISVGIFVFTALHVLLVFCTVYDIKHNTRLVM